MEALLLRLEGPLMSFGGPMVDQQGVIQDHPGLSLLTGLLGNALGYDHSESERLQDLQGRLNYAVRADRPGQKITDYQTVDLGQDHLVGTGWTTRGEPIERGKGEATEGTHIRFREYLADGRYLVAISLAKGTPSLDDLARALAEPARPLFLGRKTCLPAAPLMLRRVTVPSLLTALETEPWLRATGSTTPAEGAPQSVSAWWPRHEGAPASSREVAVTDERDWLNQIHTGRRVVRHGVIAIPVGKDSPHG